jgi:hypothetical protein
MGTRSESLIGQSVTLGLRHFFNNILVDAYQIVRVVIYNEQYQQIGVIPGNMVQRLGVGTYEVVADAGFFPAKGIYHDMWEIIPIMGASQRNLTFDINVVVIMSGESLDYNTLLTGTLGDLTACVMKKYYLWPVWQVLANGYYLPDNVIQHHIDVGITWAERQIGIPFRAKRVLTKPYADTQHTVPVKGVDYEEDGRLLPWLQIQSQLWSGIRLPHTNIIRVRGVRGIYGGRTVYRIPQEWVAGNEFRGGWVHIRPTTAGAINIIIDNNGQFLDVTLLEAIGTHMVPGFWAVDYDYGPEDSLLAKELLDLVMKRAACLLLDELALAISRGIGTRSFGVDGLSSSVNLLANAEKTQFAALVNRYQEDINPDEISAMRAHYKGPGVWII